MRGGREAEEELGAIGVRSSVGHGEDTSSSVLVGEVFVVKSSTVDGLTATAITSREVASLGHETGNDAMELGTLEVEGLSALTNTLLASAESSEVLSSLWSVLGVEVNDDSAYALAADRHIEENLGHGFCLLSQIQGIPIRL